MKKPYMGRLERWARWMLAVPEAESVIADYGDIVGTPPRPEAELLRDLGRPKEAVRHLVQPKAYRMWLAVFALLAAWSAAVLWFDWLWMHDTESFVRWIEETAFTRALLPTLWRAHSWILQYGGTAVALIGVWGLIKARLHDRRWAAVYVLALAAMLLTMESLSLLMMLSGFGDGWYVPYLWSYSAIFAVGAAGAGVLLC